MGGIELCLFFLQLGNLCISCFNVLDHPPESRVDDSESHLYVFIKSFSTKHYLFKEQEKNTTFVGGRIVFSACGVDVVELCINSSILCARHFQPL